MENHVDFIYQNISVRFGYAKILSTNVAADEFDFVELLWLSSTQPIESLSNEEIDN